MKKNKQEISPAVIRRLPRYYRYLTELERLGFTKISVTESMMTFKTSKLDLAFWSEIFAKYPGMRFSPGDPTIVLYRFVKAEPPKLLYDIISFAHKIMEEDKKNADKN